MRFGVLASVLLFVIFDSNAQSTYTANGSGAWESISWNCVGTCSTSFPGVDDTVVIPNGFSVSVDDNNDNGGPNVQADDFAGSCNTNFEDGCDDNAFHINGLFTIESGGTFTSTVDVLISGFVEVSGTYLLNDTGDDTFVRGSLRVLDGGSFTTGDSFIVTGSGTSSVTDMGSLTIGDDLWIDGDNAFVCGTGLYNVNSGDAGNGTTGNESLRITNVTGNAVLDQICSETAIQCEDNDCCSGACGDANPYADSPIDDGQLDPNEPDPSNRPSTSSVLPVEYTYFFSVSNEETITLNWQTATEKDNDRFEVERSTDGVTFRRIGVVVGHGDSNDLIDYIFSDSNPNAGANYYRLKQVDYDGAFEYSKIIVAYSGMINSLRIFPSPVINEISIIPGDKFINTNYNISVLNLSGQIQVEEFVQSQGTIHKIPLNLTAGIYILELRNSFSLERKKFVVE